jgi:membrane-bound serine protease (ClpP class)
MVKLGFLAVATGILVFALSACGDREFDDEAVHLLDYDGNVDPVMERYLERGIDDAEDNNARAIVLKLDTPGGLLDTTRNIVTDISDSRVPVIVWVAPSGAHAASAGTFITIAGHVAAMAPGTNIGAASPVGGSGEDIEGTLGEKIENDTAAFIRSIAEERGRNAEWAETAVREAASISATEAVELDVVDFVARDLEDVLTQADGLAVTTVGGRVVLDVAEAPVVENDMTLFERFLSVIADPNIAFLFLSIGGVLLLFGLLHAGTFLPETLGALMLVLGFFALSVIPYNEVGVILLGLGLLLLTAELFVPGTGALGAIGGIALILGGLFLTSSDDPDFRVSLWVLIPTAVLITVFVVFVLQILVKTRRMPVLSGKQRIIGGTGVASTHLTPDGKVQFQGEQWNATATEAGILAGETVRVTDVEGLVLSVEKFEPAADDDAVEVPAHQPRRWSLFPRRPGA